MTHRNLILLALATLVGALASCRRTGSSAPVAIPDEPDAPQIVPDRDAMRRFEGIWVDGETEAVLLQVRGDSIFYPDTANLPARFVIFNDTLLILGANNIRYPIRHQGEYTFDYVNLQGEVISLHRSDNPDDSMLFARRQYAPIVVGQLVRRDTVVYVPDGSRYHLYIDINPTSRKVFRSSYTDDGMAVQHVYYDNIIHISVYDGRRKIYSRDISKEMFSELIPSEFLSGAILSNMEWGASDNRQTTFNATLCEPEGARCYVVGLHVSYDGTLSTELTEY